MEEKVIIPSKEVHHPATAIMLNYLTNKVSMKKLFQWKTFFNERSEKNALAKILMTTAEKIIVGESVEEIEFVALMWMILRFDKDEEFDKEKIELYKEVRRLKKKLEK